MKHLIALSAILFTAFIAEDISAQPIEDSISLAPIFADDMVLQRNAPVRLWGDALPGSDLTVSLGGESAEVKANDKGHWKAELPPQSEGADLQILVKDGRGETEVINRVQFGDVFLCTGQSNMEQQLFRALNPHMGFLKPGDENIRYTKIERKIALTPDSDVSEKSIWLIPTEENARNFSAVCMHFGREVASNKGVPVGLIQATWGGSQIESWMNKDSFSELPEYSELLSHLELYAKDKVKGFEKFGAKWERWWNSLKDDNLKPWKFSDVDWQAFPTVPTRLGDWKTYGDPELKKYVGMVWYNNSIDVPEERTKTPQRLSLGGFGELGTVWINGKFLGSGWFRGRNILDVPAGFLVPGKNDVVVNVSQSSVKRDGGMLGPADTIYLLDSREENPITFGGEWRYKKSSFWAPEAPHAPWEQRNGYTIIYNGMIAPLKDLSVAGNLWYQGESNTQNADEYESLLSAMIEGWRDQFNQDLPFIIFQVSNFGPLMEIDEDSPWAEIREAQRQVAERDPNSALVVTIDIGEKFDIHPPVKWPAAQRAFRAARSVVYSEDVSPSGPRPAGLNKVGRKIRIDFKDINGSLMAVNANRPFSFMVCGETMQCNFVDAKLDGNTIILDLPRKLKPELVRYCWADSPVCNLFDTEGNPVGPFELQIKN